ncbi:hypothetical protein AGMMS49938_16510 [Fibrobacterales bacterium]|nr:hypothetical protein AGMMS49938_16510 [Fibrobacterales bacterium]
MQKTAIFFTLIIFVAGAAAQIRQNQQVQNGEKILEQANLLYANTRYPQAILLYRKAEERGANAIATSFNTANSYFQMNKLAEAAAAYKKAVEFSGGEFAPALANLAAVFFRMGEYGESVATYRRALNLDAENVSAWIYLAEAYQKTGDFVGALSALEKARELDSADVSIIYSLSEIYIAMGEFENAERTVESAYQKNPEETDFLVYLGDIYRLNKDYSSAISAYREAVALKPNDKELLYKLADCLAEDKKNFLAIDILNRVLQMDSNFTDAAIFLGNLSFEAAWFDRAENAYLLAARHGNDEAIYGLQNIVYEYVDKKRLGDAKETARKILELYPSNVALKAEFEELF